jgi:hypothetical protein
MKNYPTQKELKEIFYFDGTHLIWKESAAKKVKNKIAGSFNKSTGYWIVIFNYKNYLYHRILWIFLNGEIPEGMELDHINHDKLDNRIENLRLVSHAENNRNASIHKNSTSGVPGVSWHKHIKKWYARIHINKKRIHLGYFNNKADAYVVYKAACRKYGYHANHGKIII